MIIRSASILVLAATVAMAQPVAADSFGAIAYSPSQKTISYSVNRASREEAEAVARSGCKSSDCRTPLWFKNACGALASARSGAWGTGWGTKPAIANRYAIETCEKHGGKNCKIRLNVCTPS
ncbi:MULTISPECIES: DUF4189 domain-containing protein [unclassified Sulfitobacter]|jgi:hypothetical protein|uniref:DUF4189 domain-containing protein n=1 Tax=unclassified Sulfitobacter TaxID=196795 RepID=UPI0009EE4312|nr:MULTISPECIES: DUF4189 domain-containing protein [unclassified Sulfitobacter]